MSKRKIVSGLVCVVAGLAIWSLAMAGPTAKKAEEVKLRVGIFDSRAVACSHFGKFINDGGLEKLYREHNKTKSAGDTKRAEELEAEGLSLQKKLHMQVFGKAPIDDILKKIQKDIPQIAHDANVDILVGKWDVVYSKPSVEFIDVTNQLVNLFEPDEETLEKIKAILENPPVPAEVLENMKCEPPAKSK